MPKKPIEDDTLGYPVPMSDISWTLEHTKGPPITIYVRSHRIEHLSHEEQIAFMAHHIKKGALQ